MNILVADDDRMSREMLRRIIESEESYEVTLAVDGEDAWKKLCDTAVRYDVAIFDINMPGIDGLRLVERIRATPSLKAISVLLCTAAADRVTVAKASTLSVAHYIIKPYTKAVILEKLETVKTEIARQGLEDREVVLQRLGMDPETYKTLVTALLEEILKWLRVARYTSDQVKFTNLTERTSGLRGAAALFGLTTIVERLEEVEFTVVSDSSATEGQHSPLLLAQITPVFETLEEELKRVSRQMSLG